MKVGFFWLLEPDAWLQQAAALLVKGGAAKRPFETVCFSRQEIGVIQRIKRLSERWPYQAINDLVDVYNTAQADEVDFALISFGRGMPCDLEKLLALLVSEVVQSTVWSFRIAEISGVGMLNSPRLPFVDDHFIILNLKRAHQVKFFQRTLINASHFSSAGNRHAQLASMIEYSILKGELNNHFIAESSRDKYGQLAKLNPMPFHMCEATGFFSCYPEFQAPLVGLLELNLCRLCPGLVQTPVLRYALKRGFWYFRFGPWLTKSIRMIRRATHDIGKYEFKKHYK